MGPVSASHGLDENWILAASWTDGLKVSCNLQESFQGNEVSYQLLQPQEVVGRIIGKALRVNFGLEVKNLGLTPGKLFQAPHSLPPGY